MLLLWLLSSTLWLVAETEKEGLAISPCSYLFYGSKEVANGNSYKGGILWRGCTDGAVTELKVSFLAAKGEELVSTSVALAEGTEYYEYEVTVPSGACPEDGLPGHKLTLQLSDSAMTPAFEATTTEVSCMEKSKVIMVQMNKPLYKPGDKVEAQIFCMQRENTRSCEGLDITVSMETPSSVLMNVEHFTFGSEAGESVVVEYGFGVAEKPLLGEYCLKVESLVTGTLKECFLIEKYELPTFETQITFDQVALIQKDVRPLTGSLSATYTYGQKVQKPFFELECWMSSELVLTATYPDSRGSYQFSIGAKSLESAFDRLERKWDYPDKVRCVVKGFEFKESQLPSQSSEASIPIEEQKVIVECCDSFSCPEVVKPGNFTYCLKARFADGSGTGEALPADYVLEVKFIQCGRKDQTYTLANSAIVMGQGKQLTFTAEEIYKELNEYGYLQCYRGRSFEFEAYVTKRGSDNYNDRVSKLFSKQLGLFESTMESYLTVSVCGEGDYKTGGDVCLVVDLDSDFEVEYLLVLVKSRGIVREVRIESVSQWPYQLNLQINSEMTPNFIVFFSAWTSNGTYYEILPTSIKIPVARSKDMFSNSIEMSVTNEPDNRDYFEPGESANLRITTSSADSVVAVIGIDKRVTALAGIGNIITLDQYVEALAEHEEKDDGGDFFPFVFCWYPLPSSSGNAKQTIQDAGLVFMRGGNLEVPGSAVDYYPAKDRKVPKVPIDELRRTFRPGLHVMYYLGPPGMSGPSVERSENLINSETSRSAPSEVKKRINLKEVVLFHLLSSSDGSSNTIEKMVNLGDMTTTHTVYASAISPTLGFATVIDPLNITVFKKVFTTVHTPFSVKRTESFVMSMTVCNYLTSDLSASVEVNFNDTDFEELTSEFESCSKVVEPDIAPNECRLLECPLLAKALGDPEVSVSVSDANDADTTYDIFIQKVNVKPEGCEQLTLLDRLEVEADESEDTSICFNLSVKNIAVDNSGIAHIRLFSQMGAPALENPGNLVRMPTGCGEQTMVTLAPLTFLQRILKSSGMTLSVEKQSELKAFMLSGYQRELTYKHANGGYSAFGESSQDPASTWLTAFVAMTFSQAANGNYIDVDSGILKEAYDFMLSAEVVQPDGEVVETGRVLHSEMQGGSSAKDTLASYHLLSVSQMSSEVYSSLTTEQKDTITEINANVRSTINTALEADTSDSYLLALSGVALFDYLELREQVDPRENLLLRNIRTRLIDLVDNSQRFCGRFFWTRGGEQVAADTPPGVCSCSSEDSDPYGYGVTTRSFIVEVTSYALAFLSKMKTDETAVEDVAIRNGAIKWLECKQNPSGGFSTTQDTVTAFYAMAEHADTVTQTNLNVKVTENGEVIDEFNMQPSLEVFQYEFLDVPKESDEDTLEVCVEVEAGGEGKAYLQGELYFNLPGCPLSLDVTKIALSYDVLEATSEMIKVEFTLEYKNDVEQDSGMGMFQVRALNGYCFKEDLLPFDDYPTVQMAEVLNGGSDLALYLSSMPNKFVFVVQMYKFEKVGGQQFMEAKAGLYYDSTVQARIMYGVDALKAGSVLDPCPNCLMTSAAPGKGQPNMGSFFTCLLASVLMAIGTALL